jgi:hypothetical protein
MKCSGGPRTSVELLECRALLSIAPAADTTPPTVLSAVYEDAPHGITVRFSEWIGVAGLKLVDRATGQEAQLNVQTAVSDRPAPTLQVWEITPKRLPAGHYRATIPAATVDDAAGNWMAEDFHFDFTAHTHATSRWAYYNNSSFDGNGPGAEPADSLAIAYPKSVLRPGETPSAANVTSYSKGINGVLFDLLGLRADRTLTADDLSFRTGTAGDPSGWADAPQPTGFLLQRQHNRNIGSDRFYLVWPDGAIRNTWLQVTVKATDNTGLARDDVFYVGNLVGDTGNRPSALSVDSRDLYRTRVAHRTTRVDQTNAYDHNRDGFVNAADVAIVRANFGSRLSLPATTTVGALAPASLLASTFAPARRLAYQVLSDTP